MSDTEDDRKTDVRISWKHGHGLTLNIDLADLVSNLDLEDQRLLAQSLACETDVMKAVVDQLASGYTEAMFYGYSSEIQALREELADRMDEIARMAVGELLQHNAQLRHDLRRADEWAWKLYHAWPGGDGKTFYRPDNGKHEYQHPPSDKEVAAFLEDRA